jgi:hypothetical protein
VVGSSGSVYQANRDRYVWALDVLWGLVLSE